MAATEFHFSCQLAAAPSGSLLTSNDRAFDITLNCSDPSAYSLTTLKNSTWLTQTMGSGSTTGLPAGHTAGETYVTIGPEYSRNFFLGYPSTCTNEALNCVALVGCTSSDATKIIPEESTTYSGMWRLFVNT